MVLLIAKEVKVSAISTKVIVIRVDLIIVDSKYIRRLVAKIPMNKILVEVAIKTRMCFLLAIIISSSGKLKYPFKSSLVSSINSLLTV